MKKEVIKKLNDLDLKLIKWSVFTFTLFLITLWPWFKELVFKIHWAIWLVLAILFMAKPLKKAYC